MDTHSDQFYSFKSILKCNEFNSFNSISKHNKSNTKQFKSIAKYNESNTKYNNCNSDQDSQMAESDLLIIYDKKDAEDIMEVTIFIYKSLITSKCTKCTNMCNECKKFHECIKCKKCELCYNYNIIKSNDILSKLIDEFHKIIMEKDIYKNNNKFHLFRTWFYIIDILLLMINDTMDKINTYTEITIEYKYDEIIKRCNLPVNNCQTDKKLFLQYKKFLNDK